MLDLELLKTFVTVVDSGGFTRASDQVNRTQSTISQQIKKLEDQIGRPLLIRRRASKSIQLTEDGERLLNYARRLVVLAMEASDMLSARDMRGVVSLGVPEDFPLDRLIELLTGFNQRFPDIRLDTRNGLSCELNEQLQNRELDLALIKRNVEQSAAIATWPEQLEWVAGAQWQLQQESIALVVYEQGCLYRERAIRALEAAGQRWHIAFSSQSLASIQAAVSANIGLSLLPHSAVRPEQRIITEQLGLAAPAPTELALIASTKILSNIQQCLADYLVEQMRGNT
ncbi:LysR substrate-binding domain-containing protein [Pseudomonas sp. M30-35]|uniref:LysR substrate-binding domain-containing protein n=1 Tax=Pseudomonas sp. M30-35 TaxID=1981174 RepID=UPI000B3CD9D4|nr:LysR substrate-binding domain-containing protein [Pseudomonas sp. M30-35]ARU90609.1 LysR family transcriptional regulator [Pseudomonas sp. M30-35]